MKITYILVIASMIFQGCSVYSETSFSIKEAQDQGRVKVVDFANRSFFYDNIELRDSIYYGVNKKMTSQLRQEQLSGIYLRDTKSSKKATFAAIAVPAGIVYFIVGLTQIY
jgi:hypothetical protein